VAAAPASQWEATRQSLWQTGWCVAQGLSLNHNRNRSKPAFNTKNLSVSKQNCPGLKPRTILLGHDRAFCVGSQF
jgi:hypothetical protein